MKRPSIDEIMMITAAQWSRRSTCEHLHVGSVLAVDDRIISTGYNGAPPGLPHCEHDDMHLPYEEWSACTNTNHAEGNALAFAAKHGHSTDGATLYCTHSPCRACAGLLISAGVARVVWEQQYHRDSGRGLQWMRDAGVAIVKFELSLT